MFRERAPISLVAVLVLVAVVVGMLAGSWLSGYLNARPAKTSTAAPKTYEAQLASLLERPVVLKNLSAGSGCFHTSAGVQEFAQFGGALGPGPAYVYVGNGVNPSRELDQPKKSTVAGVYFAFNILAPLNTTGPLLVRGHERYDDRPVLFPGNYSPNETETQLMTRPTDFIIDTRQAPFEVVSNKFAVWYTVAAIPGKSPRCIGFQVDGISFTSTLTFEAENMGW